MKFKTSNAIASVIVSLFAISSVSQAADHQEDKIKSVVGKAVVPLMAKYGVPGMAIGIVINGQSYVFNYGVASTETKQAVTTDTLFEIGSVTKTFTATLASEAQINGYLSLSDKTSKYLPLLQGSKFGEVSLINLGTHTPGGLPLQLPDNVQTSDQLMQYFKEWQPTYAAGTYRTYGSPGIGTLGLITAKSMGADFTTLLERRLFPAFGMNNSFIDVPADKMSNYAQGYTKEGAPVRLHSELLTPESGGIKTTATDLARYLEANMNMIKLDEKLRRATIDTHTGYFQAGVMTQDLAWEQYSYPVGLTTLLRGNAYEMIFDPTPVTGITPAMKPREDVWINKTGSTNGFGAYVAFIPVKRLGIVILANKNYPIEDRVTVAHQILTSLADGNNN